MNDKVIAITVTYNRTNTLKKTIQALLEQSYDNLMNIIIVDNGSNDEHLKMLEHIKNLSNRIKVIYLNENLGGAGGFYKGLEYALKEYKADWYWIMDDDAYPTKHCLKELLNYKNMDNIGFLAPVIWGVGRQQHQLYHHKRISKDLINDITIFNTIEEIEEVNKIEANAFVGPLIKREVIEDIGLPDDGLFIYGDDTEYTYRITRKYIGYLVKNAVIRHEDIFDNNNKFDIKSRWKQYYKYRNRFMFINKYSINLTNKISSYLKLIKNILIIILKELLRKNSFKNKKILISIMSKSIIDGITCKRGRTIDPSTFMKN